MSATASGSFSIAPDAPLPSGTTTPTSISIDPTSGPLNVVIPPDSLVGIDPKSNMVQLDLTTIALLTESKPPAPQTIKDIRGFLTFPAAANPGGVITIPQKTISVTWFNLSPLLLMVKLFDGSEFFVPPQGTYNFENLGAQKAGEDFNFTYVAAGAATVTSIGNPGPNFNTISPRLLANFRTIV